MLCFEWRLWCYSDFFTLICLSCFLATDLHFASLPRFSTGSGTTCKGACLWQLIFSNARHKFISWATVKRVTEAFTISCSLNCADQMLLVLINCDRPAVNRRKCTISLATITLQRIFENSVYEHVCYLVGKVYMTAFNFIWPNKISFLSRAEDSSKLFSFDFKLLCSTQSSLQTQKHIEMHKLANTHTHTHSP